MAADWQSTITTNIFLAPSPPQRAGFGVALFLVDQDDGNGLNGSRVMEFASSAEVDAAEVATYISTDTGDALRAAFSQVPAPAKIKVGYRDTGGSETMSAALGAIEAADPDWYGLAIYSRVDADIVAAADWCETRTKLFVGQSDDSSWLDSGIPSGVSALADNERCAIVYHSSDAQPADLTWLCSRLVYDPDFQSAPWDGQVRGVDAITAITSAQRDFVEANGANVGLVFSSAPYFVGPGQSLTGRALYEIVSGDWYKARVGEDFAALKLAATARGQKLLVDASGQAAGLAILNGRLAQGEAAGHFARGQTRATAEAISSADLAARRLRFKVETQIGVDARVFTINVYLQPDPLAAA